MSVRMWAASGALLCTIASGAVAQTPGAFEIGGFGRATFFADTLNLDHHFGGGGWLAFYFTHNLAIEAEAAYTKTHVVSTEINVKNIPLRGRLTYNIPLGDNASSFQVGAGYVRDMYREDQHFNDDGITGLAGLRLGLSPSWSVRLSVTADYVPSPKENRADNYVNIGGQLGIGLLLNNKYDEDKDKVQDKADRCPATPKGEQVDANGCSASQRDTDGDGVKDNVDKCPNTPAGEQVDAAGCSPSQLDADGDKVTDALDKCPNTPKGEPVDASGCSASQRDADGDGVKDNVDKCPDTPKGEQVDANGCSDSQKDDDADAVPNSRDKCPNTPNGTAVDENGCPVLFEPGKKTLILKGVAFATGKSDLTPESQEALKPVAASLAARPDVRVEVQGHTDNTGSRGVNMRLSKARAVAVEKYLEANGVSPAQLTVKGYGPDKPIASNKTKDGRAQNRRVELDQIQ
jgi:outer membrane protein OmpA-like peptidoglycan-associated protein